MNKIITPRKPDEEHYVFTEGINYFDAKKGSIWGIGDKPTLDFLEKTNISGKWLNLAAGDGRYNLIFLKKADFVVASDIDESALGKLWHNTPKGYRSKLKLAAFDITKKFPFRDAYFDGVFSTGTLHIFPRKIFREIIYEIDRVIKPKGRVILDFATDIKRVLPDGKLYLKKNEPQYTLKDAEKLLKELFGNYFVKMYTFEVPEKIFRTQERTYIFTGRFLLLVAEKK